MSVELLDTVRFYGLRVRRQIAGATIQEYFTLKENGRRLRGTARAKVKARAEARDAVLEKKQKKALEAMSRAGVFNGRGGAGRSSVRGILLRMREEKSGTRTPVFRIGIMSSLSGKVVNTTVSINRHGLDVAWQKAVDYYARHKKIPKPSAIYKKLLAARPGKGQIESMMLATLSAREPATKPDRTTGNRQSGKNIGV